MIRIVNSEKVERLFRGRKVFADIAEFGTGWDLCKKPAGMY